MLNFKTAIIYFLTIFTLALATPITDTTWSFQPLPLSRSGRWIVDANGAKVPFVGINWPGAAEVMIPEGLQYQSISNIVSTIADFGFNVVRLTFAIELVDDIYAGGDVAISDALAIALGPTNGSIILGKILENNPQFTAQTTRLQVYDAIAVELAAQDIYLHLDNHVSKAMWCCSLTDGNTWFGDTYFNTTNWVRGLSFMANHGKTNWPTFTSIALRNELRLPTTSISTLESYTWNTWEIYMPAAATAVYTANPNLLIFFSGLDSDFNVEPEVGGSAVQAPGFQFTVSNYAWANKFVIEIHEYDMGMSSICSAYKGILNVFGWDATTEESVNGPAPLILSEWGRSMVDSDNQWNSAYSTCLAEYIVERTIGWMVWVLSGSYYVRQGVQDSDETYGLLNHTWDGFRGVDSSNAVKELVANTYAAYSAL